MVFVILKTLEQGSEKLYTLCLAHYSTKYFSNNPQSNVPAVSETEIS